MVFLLFFTFHASKKTSFQMESIKNEQKREAHRAPPFLGISLNNGRIDFCCQVDRLGPVSVAVDILIGLVHRKA